MRRGALVTKQYKAEPHRVGECETYKEERDVLQKRKKMEECDIEEFGTLESSEKTIAILGDRRWSQAAKQEGDKNSEKIPCSRWEKRY